MKNKILIFLLAVFFIFCLKGIFAAHYIVGYVNNAVNNVSANGHTVMMWNPVYGTSDNLTDIIGPTGNSGTSNTYMMDCQLLSHPCAVGDTMELQVINTGDNYNSANVSLVVTGAGFDVAPNMTLNAPPNITQMNMSESPINLIPNATKTVFCTALAQDPEGGPIENATAQFFDANVSFYNGTDGNNYHYTNNSCSINSSYSANQSQLVCGFNVWYYANADSWNCTILAEDNLSMWSNRSFSASINPLLSVGVSSSINYGLVNMFNVSNEFAVNVTNFGNVNINLSLYGYAVTQGDGYAMNCTLGGGQKIPIEYEKYNLTSQNPGNLDYSQFNSSYTSLTSSYTVRNFMIPQRTSDLSNNAVNTTYWRIYVPNGVAGNCTGYVVFGASTSPGI